MIKFKVSLRYIGSFHLKKQQPKFKNTQTDNKTLSYIKHYPREKHTVKEVSRPAIPATKCLIQSLYGSQSELKVVTAT